MKINNNKGITLVALVITIIVLLILAGVSIATLTGQNGILSQAQNAKNKTAESEVKEREELDRQNELIDNMVNRGSSSGGTGDVKVPEGFYHVEGTTVESGFVISDQPNDDLNNSKGGNQYVWIPVDGILGENGTTIEDVKGTNGEKKILLGRYNFDNSGIPSVFMDTNYKEETKAEHSESGYGNMIAKDIEEFISSVRKNGGYYIGRFEASKGSNNKAESKYNKAVWNSITQPNSAIACQELYTGVNSDLINSYAWDTAILFIQKYGKSNYSMEMGKSTTGQIANTGKSLLESTNKEDVQLNIYDMASNCFEWTTETYNDSNKPGIYRGGYFIGNYSYSSMRFNVRETGSITQISFRSLLYL